MAPGFKLVSNVLFSYGSPFLNCEAAFDYLAATVWITVRVVLIAVCAA